MITAEVEMRTFLCIPIDTRHREKIASLSQHLRTHIDTYASWVKPENYHITVRFLGDIDPMLTVDLERVCRAITANTLAFTIPVDRVGGFPSLERPRVLWVGGEAPSTFRELLTNIGGSLAPLGFPRPREETFAHITVARIKGRVRSSINEAMTALGTGISWNLRADRLVLMESRLTPRGAIYSPLFSLPFAGG